MNIASRLHKLEKAIAPATETAKEFFEKYGTLTLFIYIDYDTSEEEKAEIIEQEKAEYYNKIAQKRNSTREEAEKFYKKVCKQNGINDEPFIIAVCHSKNGENNNEH